MQLALNPHGPAPIVIGGVTIRQDSAGRYCLNDLHRAAGGEKRHQPSDWLRTKQAIELIEAISNSGDSRNSPVVAVPGRHGGTYVVKELVYAYAMWVSAAFQLTVIRAYDTLVQSSAMVIPKSFAEALRLAADRQEELEAAHARMAVMEPQVDALHRLADTEGVTLCQRDAAKHMQIKPKAFVQWLLDLGWTYRRTEQSRLTAFQEAIDRGYLKHKMIERPSSDGATKQEAHVRVTAKGLARLAYYIAKGRGPKA